MEEIAIRAPHFQCGFHRRGGNGEIEEAQRGLVGLQFSRHEILTRSAYGTRPCHSASYLLASRVCEKTANSAAGPGYISTHPACLRELSVPPPQSTPIVAILAFPAA